ncbi:RAMP superfamily CRISPR-associated protein [Candidatus Synechococcus calcipolaris G9]|uniref:RAMP superfamily CRISPR-associated protein n=1 Tax=Candidatus Synechococcus calcipolaris G9 TaxID=1497997 RepID=A0ABT6EZM9_9SYNE|nr:RAMP superfamily CRISPR-associated protein [Candidatus Synechococcus calcipolaris]MDG2991069.1 RAMP superfamily CRISPR-associated protein [Candidatus Synechococcus calcipolaris G9]
MVFERPKRPGTSSSQPNPTGYPGSGGNRNRGGGSNSDSNGDKPSPWLEHPLDPNPNPIPEASFVEYLRWMRSPDSEYKDPTKVQILQMAEERANYRDRLTTLTNRTKLIAGEGNTFQARCLWRIRVGGHRGPESILLPAFDALGMPYIPASTLRGVARAQAIRELIKQEGLSWKRAEETISRQYFGYLDSKKSDERSGKVIFLDAYPLPQQSGNGGGLTVDMANNIWSWDAAGQDLLYSPNPNPFYSLNEATFLIGLRSTRNGDDENLSKVKQWLSKGLQAGIGSQVNTGYGSLVRAGQKAQDDEFFSLEFTLEGQLIHGRQKFTQWNWNDRRHEWQMRGNPDAEVRPVAFKSMLRYWFRSFALGVLPGREVQQLEGQLFGSITPKPMQGWVTVRIADGKLVKREARPTRQGKNDSCGEQFGQLILACSSEAPLNKRQSIEQLFKHLTWMMFHLGGVGQGARRPCYSRRNRERAPWWRGATLIPEIEHGFWSLPDGVQRFQQLFRQRLQVFYKALGQIADRPLNPRQLLNTGQVRQDCWKESVDTNCRIVVCAGNEDFDKPYALSILHGNDFKVRNKLGQVDYDPNLCGTTKGKIVKPSPVWIANLGDYQVATVFGANQNPRKEYLNVLKQKANEYNQIFPLT